MKYAECRCREGYANILEALAEINKRAKHEAGLMYLAGSFVNAEVFIEVIDATDLLSEKIKSALQDLDKE